MKIFREVSVSPLISCLVFGVYPDECLVIHSSGSLPLCCCGDITELVSAEMLAGALVLGIILTALPGKTNNTSDTIAQFHCEVSNLTEQGFTFI